MTFALAPTTNPVSEAAEMYGALQAVKNAIAADLNDHELQLFALVAQRSGLDPFAKQIYAIKRGGKVTFQTGIDGYRAAAAKTHEYDGSDEPEYGPMIAGTPEHPEWARVTVYRRRPDGTRRPQSATAWWSEFKPASGNDSMWTKMPRNQLAKCAEALALRKAFPYVLADLYIAEEMDQAGPPENGAAVAAAAQPTAQERIAARRAALEAATVAQEATEATETPEDTPEPAETPTTQPDGPLCKWRLATKERVESCSFPEMHDGKHSWDSIAVTMGGKVVRPE